MRAFSQCPWTLRADVPRMAAMSAREEPSPVNNRRRTSSTVSLWLDGPLESSRVFVRLTLVFHVVSDGANLRITRCVINGGWIDSRATDIVFAALPSSHVFVCVSAYRLWRNLVCHECAPGYFFADAPSVISSRRPRVT